MPYPPAPPAGPGAAARGRERPCPAPSPDPVPAAVPAAEAAGPPYTLDRTCRALEQDGILVVDTPLRAHRCLALANGRIVGVDPARFDTDAELRTALLHEQAHFDSGAFYLPYSPYQLKCQAEYRADKAAVLKNLPYAELAARLRAGDTLPELAEYFCVTEDFVCKAYRFYREQGLTFGEEDDPAGP